MNERLCITIVGPSKKQISLVAAHLESLITVRRFTLDKSEDAEDPLNTTATQFPVFDATSEDIIIQGIRKTYEMSRLIVSIEQRNCGSPEKIRLIKIYVGVPQTNLMELYNCTSDDCRFTFTSELSGSIKERLRRLVTERKQESL